MATEPLVVALVAAVLVAIVIPLWARRERREAAAKRALDQQQRLPRVSAQVHTGWEQTLIGLARELRLPLTLEDLPYGALYLEHRTEHTQYVRTRSAEIGQGFLGLLELTPHPGPTSIDYSILRLPADDQVHARVLQFEQGLIAALRRLDPDLNLHTTTGALREYGSPDLPD